MSRSLRSDRGSAHELARNSRRRVLERERERNGGGSHAQTSTYDIRCATVHGRWWHEGDEHRVGLVLSRDDAQLALPAEVISSEDARWVSTRGMRTSM